MNTIIFGDKSKWDPAIQLIMTKHPDVAVLGLCDPFDEELSKTSDAVFTKEEVLRFGGNKEIDAVITVDASIPEWNEYIHQAGVENYAIPTKYYRMPEKELENVTSVLLPYGHIPPELQHLEFHLADHCNLKCKGCTHFSNLVKKAEFADMEQYRKDIRRLSELFDNIKEIHLMGGEPLLNPDVEGYIRITREAFPYAEIAIATNGLLITTMKQSFFNTILETDTMISISDYTCLDEAKILTYLSRHGIRKCELRNGKQFFAKNLNPSADGDPGTIFAQCPRRVCTFLGKGSIAACVQPFTIHYFNEYFGQHFSDEGAISLYGGLDGYGLLEALSKPMGACRYCTYEETFSWGVSKEPIPMGDWCVEKT